MKPFISFANPKVRGNPLLLFTYLVVSPLARILALANVSPQSVTHLSNLAFGASLFFFFHNNTFLFSALLIVSFVLDVADGMVARFANSSSARGSLYDHSSDDIKLILLLFVVGIQFNTEIVWILAFIASGSILLVSSNSYAHSFKDVLNRIAPEAPLNIEEALVSSFWLKRLVRGVVRSLFRLDGNFMYYFFLLNPNDKNITEIVLIVIIGVTTTNLLYSYLKLYKQAKDIDQKHLKWK